MDVAGVDWVNVHLADGTPISIYSNHAPLVALHAACDLKYRIRDEVTIRHVTKGVLSITDNTVKCLVEGEAQQPTAVKNQTEEEQKQE